MLGVAQGVLSTWSSWARRGVVITLLGTTSEMGLSALARGDAAPNKGHLWAYRRYSDVSEQETLTLKCYYLRLTMYDHNPINEGRN